MSTSEAISLGTALVVLANTLISYWLHRRLTVVAHEINSVKDELVATTKKEAFARGVVHGEEHPK